MSERGSDREGPDGQTRMTLRPRAKDKRRRELVPVVERLPISRGGVARGRRSRDARSEKKGEEIAFESGSGQVCCNEEAESVRGGRSGRVGKRRLSVREREGERQCSSSDREMEKMAAKEMAAEETDESEEVDRKSEMTESVLDGERESEREHIFIPKLKRTHASHLLATTHITDSAEVAELDVQDGPDEDIDTPVKDPEYPQPSTNFQKTQRKLARERQLQEFYAREASLAREERLMKRRGLVAMPTEGAESRHVMWKEALVEVICYSPYSSSRGSTLEPEDLPENT